MTQSCEVDVLVVGLGPAGASAAGAASRSGLRVLAVDRKAQIGVPVQCAEWIPMPLAGHAQAGGVLSQRIAGMVSNLPSRAQEYSKIPGLMVDRAAFDQALAIEAVNCGAEVRCATQWMKLDAERSVARLKSAGGEYEIAYRMLIAADGPHSPVARELGLSSLEIVQTRQYTVPLLKPCVDTEVWLSNEYPDGYAWLFPKGAWANLGLGMNRDGMASLKQALDALHHRLVGQGRVGVDVVYRTGGAIPVGGLRERLVMGNVLFVGDAAGLTHPVTGAGIAAAVASGERAGQAAARCLHAGDVRALSDYEEDIRDQFEPGLQRAVARRRWLSRQRHGSGIGDDVFRRSWIAFPEYFENATEVCFS